MRSNILCEMHSKDIEIRPLREDEIGFAYELEKEGFPEDEAATFDTMMYRHSEAPELTVGYFDKGELVGFISGTRFHEPNLTHAAMNMHIPNGESVCIHGVCVAELRRRQGIASRLLDWYTDAMKTTENDVKRILLIAHSKLIPLYTRAGFTFKCKSNIVHGKEAWYEMEMLV